MPLSHTVTLENPAPRSWPLLAVTALAVLLVAIAPAWAQTKTHDDHEMTDRFYIRLGGFQQTDLRTTLRLDAKTPQGGIAIGALIGLESLFSVEDQVTTFRLDGWWRFTKKHRLGWTYFQTSREGISTFGLDEPIDIGDITIQPGDGVATEDKNRLIALQWSYSFLNMEKYEAWIGAGLNMQSVDTSIVVSVGGDTSQPINESAKATVPIPTFNFGGRWNFTKKWRMFLTQELFGLKIQDFEGRLSNTRTYAEYIITRNFGIGAGFERFKFEINAEGEDFIGQLDTSYTGFALYVMGQF